MNLKDKNQALLIKLLDKFYKRCDIPWVQLVWSAYYDNCVPHAKPICGSFWWRDVAKMMNVYRGITKCKVRAGDTVLLWKDPWCSPVLSETSARLFSFATSEDVSVAEFVGTQDVAAHFSTSPIYRGARGAGPATRALQQSSVGSYDPGYLGFCLGEL
jgi:hypothetical protein